MMTEDKCLPSSSPLTVSHLHSYVPATGQDRVDFVGAYYYSTVLCMVSINVHIWSLTSFRLQAEESGKYGNRAIFE